MLRLLAFLFVATASAQVIQVAGVILPGQNVPMPPFPLDPQGNKVSQFTFNVWAGELTWFAIFYTNYDKNHDIAPTTWKGIREVRNSALPTGANRTGNCTGARDCLVNITWVPKLADGQNAFIFDATLVGGQAVAPNSQVIAVIKSPTTRGDPILGADANTGAWVVGQWGLCDRTCGGGLSVRTVECQAPGGKTGGKYCGNQPRPDTSMRCNIGSCPQEYYYTWEFDVCANQCAPSMVFRYPGQCMNAGTMTPSTDMFGCATLQTPSTYYDCNTDISCEWVRGPWGPPCGGNVTMQYRMVECWDSNGNVAYSGSCDQSSKPITQLACGATDAPTSTPTTRAPTNAPTSPTTEAPTNVGATSRPTPLPTTGAPVTGPTPVGQTFAPTPVVVGASSTASISVFSALAVALGLLTSA